MHPRARGVFVIAALMTPAAAFAQAAPTTPDDATTAPDGTGSGSGSAANPEPAPEPPRHPKALEIAPDEPDAFAWKPYGFMRLQYIAVQNDPNVAFVGRDDGFELQNARIGVIGKLGSRAAFNIAIDGALDERAQLNTPEGKLKVGLRDAYGDVGLTGPVVVRAGYFQSWVDPIVFEGDRQREFVDKPLESRGMRATEGWQTPGLPPGRSLGVAVRLDPAWLLGAPVKVTSPGIGFELAVQNGADEFASNNDNDKPAVSGSLVVRLPRDGWGLVSVRYNPRTIGDLPFRQDETDIQGTAGAQIVAGPVQLQGGLILQHTIFESTNGPSQDAYGAHAQVMFEIPASLPFALGYRFAVMDPSNLIVTDQVMEHTVGAVLGVPSYRMRFQLQLTHVQEQAARDLSNDRAQLAAELSL